MEEIQRYADLLALIDASGADMDSKRPDPASASLEEDAEAEEWASLLLKASPGLMQKARLRICAAGLSAVHRHITNHPHSD